MLFTSYRLAAYEDGMGKRDEFARVKVRLGSVEAYGQDTPIAFDTLIGIGLAEALWALRAVYPEQRTIARGVGRKFAIAAYTLAAKRFPGSNGYLDSLVKVGSDYVWGLATVGAVAEARREAWKRADQVEAPGRWLAYAAWLALTVEPYRHGPAILDCAQRAQPETDASEHIKVHKRTEISLRDTLASLVDGQDLHCVGPVCKGFRGSMEPPKPKRIYRTRDQMRLHLERQLG